MSDLLAQELELTCWCPVHIAVLRGAPRLCFDPDRGAWFLVLSSMSCPSVTSQTECISQWIVHLVPTVISPEQARARRKTETT